jgi:hypothetical protein
MTTNLWLWDKKNMVVGTKLFSRKKIYGWERKHRLWEQEIWYKQVKKKVK